MYFLYFMTFGAVKWYKPSLAGSVQLGIHSKHTFIEVIARMRTFKPGASSRVSQLVYSIIRGCALVVLSKLVAFFILCKNKLDS
jgi:hypothetical protein